MYQLITQKNRDHYKTLSLKSLIGMALQYWDSDVCWSIVFELQTRTEPQIIQCMQIMFGTNNWRKRTLAIEIMSQSNFWDNFIKFERSAKPLFEKTNALLLTALNDSHPEVIGAAIFGFKKHKSPKALPLLLKYVNHSDRFVRKALASTLGKYLEPESIKALIELAADTDSLVREWANFELWHISTDTPEIRERLWLNTSDSDEAIRVEAFLGLADRLDSRAICIAKALVQSFNDQNFDVSMSTQLVPPALFPLFKYLWEILQSNSPDIYFWQDSLKKSITECIEKSTP